MRRSRAVGGARAWPVRRTCGVTVGVRRGADDRAGGDPAREPEPSVGAHQTRDSVRAADRGFGGNHRAQLLARAEGLSAAPRRVGQGTRHRTATTGGPGIVAEHAADFGSGESGGSAGSVSFFEIVSTACGASAAGVSDEARAVLDAAAAVGACGVDGNGRSSTGRDQADRATGGLPTSGNPTGGASRRVWL